MTKQSWYLKTLKKSSWISLVFVFLVLNHKTVDKTSWNPPPSQEDKGGREEGGILLGLEYLKFSPTPGRERRRGRLSQMGEFKISHTFFLVGGTTTRFSLLGDGRRPSPTGQKLLIPLAAKCLPSRLLPPNF